MSAVPLVAVTEGPAPPPALARLAPRLLQILAEGGAATEIYYGQRYWLRLWETSGRPVWTTPAHRYAWEQLRERRWVERREWRGNQAIYQISEAGREVLSELAGR